jgi:hypothetical protein
MGTKVTDEHPRSLNIEQAHLYEEELRQKIKGKNPKHPILKKVFCSTWEAIDQYEKVLMEELL